MTELIFVGLTVAACLYVLDRQNRRSSQEHGQAGSDWSAYAVSLHQTLERERDAHRAEIQSLLQRIQAPDVAVVQHQQQTLDDNENTYPLTDEESAERQNEVQRMIADMERLENAGLV